MSQHTSIALIILLLGLAVKYSATDVYDGNVKLKELKVTALHCRHQSIK